MLDLRNYLKPEDDYVIIKRNDIFPRYRNHSDLDIITHDAKALRDVIAGRHDSKLSPLRIYETYDHHVQLDYHIGRALNFKFDLIDSIEFFKDDKLSQMFIDEILTTSQQIELDDHMWNIPSIDYDVAIRKIEFIMYPKKIKHKHFIDKYLEVSSKALMTKYSI